MEKEAESKLEVEFISTSGVFKTPFALIILVQLFLGGIILIIVNLWFINSIYFLLTGNDFYPFEPKGEWYFWLLVPLSIYGNLFLFTFLILAISGGFYRILNKLHPPQEGIFERGSKDWKYMHRRFWIAYLPIWLARALPLPWIDIVCYRIFGVHIGKNVVAYEGYIDPEFIEIGDFTMTSLNICIFSHLIYHDKVIIKKVKIGDQCIIGPQTIISPGTIMHKGAILGANSYTWIGQELEGDLIHVGTPVRMTFQIQSVEESLKKADIIKKDDYVKKNGGENL